MEESDVVIEPEKKKQRVSSSTVTEIIVYEVINNKVRFSKANQDEEQTNQYRDIYFRKLSLEKEPEMELKITNATSLTPLLLNSLRLLHASEIELYLLERQLSGFLSSFYS